MFKTILLFIHLASFAMSFGLVLFSDVMMAQVPWRGKVSRRQLELIKTSSRWILRSLVVLVLSGLGFLVYYALTEVQLLQNPKLYAKMTIVTVLSVNGYWLHRFGLASLERARVHNLKSRAERCHLRKLLASGALSAISWWSAFAFGVFKELNFKYSFLQLMAAYGLVVLTAFIGVELFIRLQAFDLPWKFLNSFSRRRLLLKGLALGKH